LDREVIECLEERWWEERVSERERFSDSKAEQVARRVLTVD